MGFRTIGTLTNHWRNTSRTSGAQLCLRWSLFSTGGEYFFQIHPVMKRSKNKSLQGSYCWFFINQLNHLLHMWIRMKHQISSRNQLGALMPYFWSIKRYYIANLWVLLWVGTSNLLGAFFFQTASILPYLPHISFMTGKLTPPPNVTPPRSKALSVAYEPLMSLNTTLLKSNFNGGAVDQPVAWIAGTSWLSRHGL